MKRTTDRPRPRRSTAAIVLVALVGGPAEASHAAQIGTPSQPAVAGLSPAQDRRATTDPKSAAEPRLLDLGDRVIRKAIADSKDPSQGVPISHGAAFGSGTSTKQQAIDRAFQEAEIPTCMKTDAYKFDPPRIAPFGLGGLLALPFLVHAIATGKCRR